MAACESAAMMCDELVPGQLPVDNRDAGDGRACTERVSGEGVYV